MRLPRLVYRIDEAFRWRDVEMGLAMSSPQRRIVREIGFGGMVEVKQRATGMAATAEGQV